jgi:hypothetical protein
MKRILFLLLIGLSSNLIFAQDIIVKQSGDEIKTKILEITSETIKYKEFEFQDGPTRNINISEVFMVIYENGKREKFTSIENQTSKEISKNEVSNDDYKGNYFMLGTGYGNSYGGIGLRIQWRMGGNQGFGVHAGAGYFPGAPILASAGVKFFPYKDLYINAQFGLTGYEEYYEYYEYYDGYSYDYRYYDESHILFGPSFLVGGDWTWGSKVGYGFNAGLGISYNINAEYFSAITLALDLGFIIRF